MMITLCASLLGFVSSMFPSFIKCWQDKKDKQHELAILKLQVEADKQKYRSKLDAIGVHHDVELGKAIYKTYYSGIKWLDALNGTVRPVIAYGFFGLYASCKWMIWSSYGLLWTEEDQAVFAGIIAFYYGQRAFYKSGNGNGGNGNGGSNGHGK